MKRLPDDSAFRLLLRKIPRERPRDRSRHDMLPQAAFAAATSTFSIAASVRADSANVRPRNACATSNQRLTASLMPKTIKKRPANFSSERETIGLARSRCARQ